MMSEWEGERVREVDDWVRMSKRVRWRQLCLGASNWVLIELAPREVWMDGEMKKESLSELDLISVST